MIHQVCIYYKNNATCWDKTFNMYFYIFIFNNLITLNRTYNCLPIALMILHSCCKGCETVAIVIPLRQENYCCSQSEWLVCKLHQWPNVFFISLTAKACHIFSTCFVGTWKQLKKNDIKVYFVFDRKNGA